MSTGAPATEEDLTGPATKADLVLLKSDLEGQIKDVDRKIDMRIAEVKASLTYTAWLAMATLGGAMALLRLF